ncbi:hypothetical protein NFI96_023048 [Prochilodus magdalenae]|nr:hypothetical protein NFI96_023048 [Prochilodus magdalenae]
MSSKSETSLMMEIQEPGRTAEDSTDSDDSNKERRPNLPDDERLLCIPYEFKDILQRIHTQNELRAVLFLDAEKDTVVMPCDAKRSYSLTPGKVERPYTRKQKIFIH